jgi:DNA repair exonuclease SbcCD nuclease subunit
MKLPALLCSDLHLTANPRDEYRWGLFKWLLDVIVKKEVRTLLMLGDLTDAKDYHPSSLTNRLVDAVAALSWLGADVWVLMGNHDYLRKGHAYFSFLKHLPNVRFVTEMTEVTDDGKGPSAMMLPHTKDPAGEWAGLDFTHYDLLFMHQTVSGAVASNGQEMRGEPLPWLQSRKVWSGDIHVPQVIGAVEYVGSPYHVHFGDAFTPRCVLLDRRGRPEDLHYPTIKRHMLRFLPGDESAIRHVRPGDQVKAVIELAPSERHEWRRVQREVMAMLKGAGADVHELRLESASAPKGPTPCSGGHVTALSDDEALLAFVEARGLGVDAHEAGLETMQ